MWRKWYSSANDDSYLKYEWWNVSKLLRHTHPCFIIIPFMLPFVLPAAAGQAFLFWFSPSWEGWTWYWLYKAAETSRIVKKIPLKSILMLFEENYELAAAKLKGYSFKFSSFCHIYSKHHSFKSCCFKATGMSALYKISLKAGLKIEIIIEIQPWIVSLLH